MIRCSNCGNFSQDGSAFCGSCGVSFVVNSTSLVNEQNNVSQNNVSQNNVSNFNNNSMGNFEQVSQNDFGQNLNQNNGVNFNNNLSNQINMNVIDSKLEKIKKTYLILTIIGLIFAILRIPYLFNEYFGVHQFLRDSFDLISFFAGIGVVVTYALAIGLNNNQKIKYIFGLISGIITFFTGNLLACIVGILLIVDSIYPIKHIK